MTSVYRRWGGPLTVLVAVIVGLLTHNTGLVLLCLILGLVAIVWAHLVAWGLGKR